MPSDIEILINSVAVPRIPRSPGVYQFYDVDGVLLYVGKSVNLRARINSHFSAPTLNGRRIRISDDIKRINLLPTSTPLAGELLELHLIKTLSPLYNRRSRRHRHMLAVSFNFYADKLLNFSHVSKVTDIDPKRPWILFRTKHQAYEWLDKIARSHNLCPARLSLEHSQRACFAHQLGRCAGVCVGKETINDHDNRLRQIVKKRQFQAWPAKGPIELKATGQSVKENLVIDNWHLCSLDLVYPQRPYSINVNNALLDYDSYRLLEQHPTLEQILKS